MLQQSSKSFSYSVFLIGFAKKISMHKYLVLLLMASIQSIVCLSQSNNFDSKKLSDVRQVKIKLPDFSNIHIGDEIVAEILEGSHNELIIEAEKSTLPFIKAEVKLDTLVISTDKTQINKNHKPIKIFFTVKLINSIKVDTGSSLECKRNIVADSLNIILKFNSQLTSTIDVSKLNLSIEEESIANLSGFSLNGRVSVSNGSRLDAESLSFDNCRILVNNNSNAYISVNKILSAYINQNSFLTYTGEPEFRFKVTNMSKIKKKN
jgi:hypothetical protein